MGSLHGGEEEKESVIGAERAGIEEPPPQKAFCVVIRSPK